MFSFSDLGLSMTRNGFLVDGMKEDSTVILFCSQWICSCFSCKRMLPTTQFHLQHTLKGIQGKDQEWDTLCSGKTGRMGPQVVRYFQEKIYEPRFLHLLILRKTLKSLTEIPVPRDQQQPSTKMCSWWHVPLCQNHIYTDSPLLPLWNSSSELLRWRFPGYSL